ncbi:phosphate ABC transporter permease subunit PstC [Alkalinema sp. FACHB-956]|uniref:phosphate ABC transporter permease subunit PstC n=1 Tax=Alkalinema sp. FACHB-956 TaxID=2692768 RepID=UPI0016836329|nr:phosphate ABC transporter permease subunit PstC [Alkalinema sp. FACHB-956]MBD2326470.1 phosphate ABC transporter permease subunit PstC [Alkalinema sp. FACHB-956]
MARSLPSLAASVQQAQRRRSVRQVQEKVIESILFLAAFSCVAVTIAIMVILGVESFGLFKQVSIVEFLTGIEWAPLFEPPKYGVLPLISGTLTTTMVALLVAIPLGTTIALFLSEFASTTVREWAKPVLELLAGIPTVVYGYFALLFITPLLQALLPDLGGFNMLSAGMVMGIMITPLISSISEDALRSVPAELREGSYATGATRLQTAYKVVLPAALSGVSSSYILGISRAVGETMIVAISAGLQPTLTLNPLDSAATMTAYIVQVSLGDLPHGTTGYQTIFAVGLALVLMTLLFNIIGHFLSKRYRERY